MILITEAFLAASAVGANNPRIGYQSHIRDLELTAAEITVSSEAADGPRDAPVRESTEEFWQPTSLPATWEIDFTAFVDVNYVGLLGFNLDGIEVTLETSDGSVTGSPSELVYDQFASDVIPDGDAPLMFLDTVRSINKLRITLDSDLDIDEMPKLAVVYAGEVLEMYRPCYGGVTPMNMSRSTVLYSALSQGGQLLAQGFRRHGLTGALPFKNLPASWVRGYFDPFIKHARNLPYFVAWRPQSFPLEVAYAWTSGDIRPSNMGVRDLMQVTIPMMGIGDE